MRLRVIQNGRLRDPHIVALRDEYRRRFRRYGRLDICERQPRGEAGIWAGQRGWKVLLDEHGELLDSVQLAERLATWSMRHGDIAFAIGSADGHDEATRRQADWVWSLSPLVLPHQIAHLLVVEQCYRAGAILAGDPYHRA